jgi:hypothetical protein
MPNLSNNQPTPDTGQDSQTQTFLFDKCFICNKIKPLSEFYAHPQMANGHLGKCKECTKIDVHLNYHAKWSDKKKYDQERDKKAERKLALLEYQRKMRANNPLKYRARNAVSYAIASGKLVRLPCVVCGNPKSQGHHHDYSKPLDVEWLCHKCHLEGRHGQRTK